MILYLTLIMIGIEHRHRVLSQMGLVLMELILEALIMHWIGELYVICNDLQFVSEHEKINCATANSRTPKLLDSWQKYSEVKPTLSGSMLDEVSYDLSL